MPHEITIAGSKIEIAWTVETSKRYAFRMGEIGGEPTTKQLSNPRSVTTALFKVLWGLLPPREFEKYPDPESLFVAVDHEKEGEAIYAGIKGIFEERLPSEEKKSTLTTSPSLESNSG
jgi:hypothetical protein